MTEKAVRSGIISLENFDRLTPGQLIEITSEILNGSLKPPDEGIFFKWLESRLSE